MVDVVVVVDVVVDVDVVFDIDVVDVDVESVIEFAVEFVIVVEVEIVIEVCLRFFRSSNSGFHVMFFRTFAWFGRARNDPRIR